MIIPIKLLTPTAKVPTRAHADDAGADLYSDEDHVLSYGERVVLKTGVAVSIPPGWYGRVAPRSGLAVKKGLDVLAGVIDVGYIGEIGVVLINHGGTDIVIARGDKIAQLIIERCASATFAQVESLDETTRGAGGYGSTDAVPSALHPDYLKQPAIDGWKS